MAPSFDFGVLSLFRGEEKESIHYDDVDDNGVDDLGAFEEEWSDTSSGQTNIFDEGKYGKEEDLMSDECLGLMMKNEIEHLPASDYLERLRNGDLNLGDRLEAVGWMEKVHAHFSFGPLCAYLSVNYLDRFLSAYDLPKGKAWMLQLLAVACLSLGAKMEETEVPLCPDLQVCDSKFVFEARTIQRMELLVLSTLKWRMQAITPFSFIDSFLAKINKGGQMSSRLLIFRSTQLISGIIKGIDFLEFRPSEIAAAVAMSVAGQTQTVDTENPLYELIHHLQKERVVKCVELLNRTSSISGTILNGPSSRLVPSFSVPLSPIGVLDASACLSYRTDDSTVGSCANSSNYNSSIKRRKFNRPFELEL